MRGVRGWVLSLPQPPVLGAGGWSLLPVRLGRGGRGLWDPSPTPQRTLLRAGFARFGGGSRALGGVLCASVRGVRGRAVSLTHTARPRSRWPGPAACFPWARGVRAWGPITNPTAHALACWLCALWGRLEGARGGALCLCEGCPGSGSLSPPHCPSSDQVAGARCLFSMGAGGASVGTCHQPHSARSCELALHAVGASQGRLGGPGRASVRGVRRLALPLRQRPVLEAGGQGLLPVFRGRGTCAGEDPSPTPQRTLLRACFALCGGVTRAPGEAARASVRGVRGWKLSSPRTARSLGRQAEPAVRLLWAGGGGVGGGTRHQPHTARSWELALRAVGAAPGRPPGGASCLHEGRPGSRISLSRPHILGACCRGSLPAGGGCGVPAWGPALPAGRASLRPLRSVGGSVFLGTFSRAVVRCLLCALPGFAAVGGCCCLAPVRVPWLWPSARLLGGPRGPVLVRSASSGQVALGAQFGFPVAMVPSPTGDFRPRIYMAAARGTWRSAENRAHAACRWPLPRQGHWVRSASYPFGAPQWGCPWGVSPALVLGCVRCGELAYAYPLTQASGVLYRPSFDGGLGQCTGAVLCGRRHLPFPVGERHTRAPGVCASTCSAWAGFGEPASWVRFGARHLSFGRFVLFHCSATSDRGCHFLFFCLFPRSPVARASAVSGFLCFQAQVPLALALCVLACPPPPPSSAALFHFPCVPCTPVVSGSGVPLSLASGALGLGAVRFPPSFLLPPPPPCCVCCALCCLLLPCSVLRVVLWWPALCCCGLLRVVRCSLGRLFVLCATGCCCVLCRVSGRVVPLRCSRSGLLSCLGLCCRMLRCDPGFCAAPHCFASCCAVVRCFVFSGYVWCRCLLCRALGECPSPWGVLPSGAVFCRVSLRFVLCAVWVLPWCVGACCCSPLCFVLCVSWGVVLFVFVCSGPL